MAKAISDVPENRAYSPQPNLNALPFMVQFLGGTFSTATSKLPPGMRFSSKTGTGTYRFVVPSTVASKYWVNGRLTSNFIVSFTNADALVPTGYLDIVTGTSATVATAADPADGVQFTGTYFAGWGR